MQRDLKTIAPLSHQPIVLTDTIDYRTIGFLHYRPNPIQVSKHLPLGGRTDREKIGKKY